MKKTFANFHISILSIVLTLVFLLAPAISAGNDISLEEKREKSAMINSSKVLLGLNASAISKLKKRGFGLQEMICLFLAENASQDEVVNISPNTVQLSFSSKQWCFRTHIYKDKNGGITVLDQKIDENTRQENGLEYLESIDPQFYMAALCIKFKIKDKEIRY